jgi:nicotinamidase-related amidase
MKKLFLIPLMMVFTISLVFSDLLTPTLTLAQQAKPAYRPPPPIITDIKMPQPKPVTLNVEKTALLVMELSDLCADPTYPAHKLVAGITKLIDKARAAGMLIVFTIPSSYKGQPYGQIYSGFKRRPSEPLFYPSGLDKLTGDMHTLLKLHGIETLLMVGQRSNMALLHTGARATMDLNYEVVIPIDGIAANTDYEKEYGLLHFTLMPRGAERFTFTTLDMIGFNR